MPSLLHRAQCVLRCSLLAILLAGSAVQASILIGEVVGIADGDTVTVLDATRIQYKIRLSGIDAPERKQSFGEKSQQNMAALVFRKQVTVDWHKTDRYGRLVGKVVVGGQDVGLEQIRVGLAWHYKAYELEQPLSDRMLYARAEGDARRNRRGLWVEPDPPAPWDFRRSRRN